MVHGPTWYLPTEPVSHRLSASAGSVRVALDYTTISPVHRGRGESHRVTEKRVGGACTRARTCMLTADGSGHKTWPAAVPVSLSQTRTFQQICHINYRALAVLKPLYLSQATL